MLFNNQKLYDSISVYKDDIKSQIPSNHKRSWSEDFPFAEDDLVTRSLSNCENCKIANGNY